MKRKSFFLLLSFLALWGCNNQVDKGNETFQKHESDSDSTITEIQVNREYDEEGNLIRYDSAYSSFYSNVEYNQALRDSIYGEFRREFYSIYPFANRPFFNDLFFEDSLRKYDFYRHDFFSERFRQNMSRMDRLFWEMDSIKNQYFRDQFPEKQPDNNN